MAFESGKRTTLAKPVSPWDTTIYLASAPTVTNGRLYIKNEAQEERIAYTGVSGNSVTGCSRNISKTADPLSSWAWLTRVAWCVVKLVIMHDQLVDKTWSNTRTGNQTINGDLSVSGNATITWTTTAKWITFTGTDNYGLRIKSLTTAQRDALTPTTGDAIINTTTGTVQTYYGGTWNDNGTSTTPNASTTVAGKVEKATSGEVTAWTSTWWTWAELFVWPAELKTVTDWLTTSINAKPSIATNATASTGSNTTNAINALQLKKYFWPEPSAGTTYTAASASTLWWVTSADGTYAQNKIGTIARTWTYTVSVAISAVSFWTQWYARIYKNWVAFSSEQTNATWSPVTVTWDLAYTEADTISLWIKSNGWWSGTVTMSDLSIKYDLVNQNAFTLA